MFAAAVADKRAGTCEMRQDAAAELLCWPRVALERRSPHRVAAAAPPPPRRRLGPCSARSYARACAVPATLSCGGAALIGRSSRRCRRSLIVRAGDGRFASAVVVVVATLLCTRTLHIQARRRLYLPPWPPAFIAVRFYHTCTAAVKQNHAVSSLRALCTAVRRAPPRQRRRSRRASSSPALRLHGVCTRAKGARVQRRLHARRLHVRAPCKLAVHACKRAVCTGMLTLARVQAGRLHARGRANSPSLHAVCTPVVSSGRDGE